MKLVNIIGNPTFAFTTFTTWILIFVVILGYMGAFSDHFMQFGPSSDPKLQAVFLGTHIDTWTKTIAIMILGFTSSMFSTYYYTVFGSWLTNTIRDHKAKDLKMSWLKAMTLTTMNPLITGINGVLEFFVTLTMQLQFIFPQILGQVLTTIITTRSFLSKKKKFA